MGAKKLSWFHFSVRSRGSNAGNACGKSRRVPALGLFVWRRAVCADNVRAGVCASAGVRGAGMSTDVRARGGVLLAMRVIRAVCDALRPAVVQLHDLSAVLFAGSRDRLSTAGRRLSFDDVPTVPWNVPNSLGAVYDLLPVVLRARRHVRI